MNFRGFLNNSTLILSIILSFTQFYSIEGRSDEGKIGEIRYSILSPGQFRELYGEGWELMQGQALDRDSDLLHLWGQDRIPDARGVYLRSANHGRPTTEGNPQGDVHACGAYLSDQFKSHNHGGGDHSHDISCELSASRNHQGHVFNTMASGPDKLSNLKSSQSGNIITFEGGSETRPRSIIVNTYIKVRETARAGAEDRRAAPALEITPEVMNVIITRPEFQRAVENAVTEMMNRRNR